MRSQKKTFDIRNSVSRLVAVISGFIGFFTFISPNEAFAYVDPNVGGYVFQWLFPIFSAIAAGYLFFRNQIKRIFHKIKGVFKSNNVS